MAEISTMPKAVIDNAKEIAKKISSEKQVQNIMVIVQEKLRSFVDCVSFALFHYCNISPLLIWPFPPKVVPSHHPRF